MGKRKSVSDIYFNDKMTVELVQANASDKIVAQSARVSTVGEGSLVFQTGGPEVDGLINFLMRERHGSPFEHATFTFYVRTPIFVWREHMRHRIASYNEESGRYKELSPEFYIPAKDRKLVQVGKAGAYTFEEGTDYQYANVLGGYMSACKAAYNSYLGMLEVGIAREVARGILPLNIYSSAYVTINARSLMNFLSLRQNVEGQHFPSYPQREIEMVAEKYEEFFAKEMPSTYKAFVTNGRVAP
jgi:thymidylate synthase (FAD)